MPDSQKRRVKLVHGDGGTATRELIHELFLPQLGNHRLALLDDAASITLPPGGEKLVVSTDSFVVSPLEFPGGDIGGLSVHGTVNDLCVCGARPLWLTAGFIIEEGLCLEVLRRVVRSLGDAARQVGVSVIASDTKVVGRGHGDGLYINTAGVGVRLEAARLGLDRIRPGDVVMVSGFVGDHGVCILAHREGLEFSTPVASDCGSVAAVTADLIAECTSGIRFMRDPTRGGLATALAEIAEGSGHDIVIDEEAVPVRSEVRAAAEMLGLDPLYLANEGKVVVIAARDAARHALSVMRSRDSGMDAAVLGEVRSGDGALDMVTTLGGTVRLGVLHGDALPRIC